MKDPTITLTMPLSAWTEILSYLGRAAAIDRFQPPDCNITAMKLISEIQPRIETQLQQFN